MSNVNTEKKLHHITKRFAFFLGHKLKGEPVPQDLIDYNAGALEKILKRYRQEQAAGKN